MKIRWLLLFGIALIGGARADDGLRKEGLALFGRIESATAVVRTRPEVELGRALFWDTRISSDGKTACASCHLISDWGADSRRFSIDARGKPTSRHSPTIFNAMMQPSMRWLGDRSDGAEQAEGSITGSMGFATKQAGVDRMRGLDYASAFRTAFPDDPEPLSAKNYGLALQAYQASLTTPAAFDRFLAGSDSALSPVQRVGLRTFIDVGCAGCHNGPLLGGTSFQRFGLTQDYWVQTKSTNADAGRFAMTKKEEDRNVFRVPMLRNVAKTAPYFHDGSVARLDEAVRVMAALQLGRALDAKTTDAIVAFLEALTGDIPPNYAPPGQTPQGTR
jgi:cytochrome c peroxidase